MALCAAGLVGFAANAAAADDTSAVIEDLKRRINALEAQVKAQQQTAAPAAAPAAVAAAPAPAAGAGDFKLSWGGFVKLDTIGSFFSDGPVAQGTGRDFYLPGAIPVAAVENARDYTDFIAKETRLFLKGDGTVLSHKVGAYVEFDFISGQISQATGGAGNEAVTNAYNPSLRRAYITFDNLLLGQDWSTFQNLVALPDTLDFVAWPSDGTVFNRQPQIRYTLDGLSVALENPNTTVAARRAPGAAAFAVTNDNTVPDFVAKYTLKTGFGDFSLAGIVRQLADRNTVGAGNDTAIGYGASLAGRIPVFGKDDIRFTVSGGDGIGRYLALNTVGDAVVNRAGKLHSAEIYNGFIAYRHPWNEQWRTNLVVSAFHANTGQAAFGSDFGDDVSRNIRSASINLLYSPIPKLTLGGEYRHARRDTVGNLSGDLDRVQLSAKLSF
ncbi:MAG: DcaP family trimeric outer membrane transporter [Nevskia sp.]